ncbi:MAG: MlaD family protein [bacterium]
MNNQKVKTVSEFKAGIFIVSTVGLFIFGVLWLRYFALMPQMKWNVLFKKPGILSEGFKVYYQGLEVGKISKIELSKDYKYTIVRLNIYQKDFILPNNTTASVVSEGIAGQKFIVLNLPDKPSKVKLKDGAWIKGQDVYTLTDLQDSIKDFMQSDKLKNFIAQSQELMNLQVEMSKNMNQIAKDNKNDIRTFSKNAAGTSILVKSTLANVDGLLSDRTFKGDIRQILSNGSAFSSDLRKITGDENIKTAIKNAAEASENFKQVSKDSKDTLKITNNTLGVVNNYTNKVSNSQSGPNLFSNLNETVLASQEAVNSIKCLSDGVSEMLSKKFLLFKFAFGQPGKALNSCTRVPSTCDKTANQASGSK